MGYCVEGCTVDVVGCDGNTLQYLLNFWLRLLILDLGKNIFYFHSLRCKSLHYRCGVFSCRDTMQQEKLSHLIDISFIMIAYLEILRAT
jgi:hypothetical protein